MNIKSLIPKDKFDIETAKKLSNYSFEEIQPIVPYLLEWLQDWNWPVSKTIAGFFNSFFRKYFVSTCTNLTRER